MALGEVGREKKGRGGLVLAPSIEEEGGNKSIHGICEELELLSVSYLVAR